MKTSQKVGGSAAVIAATVVFLPVWEGMDTVAKKDAIGTGHPVTYCYGMTNEVGVVKEGTRFTKQQCDKLLAPALEKYWKQIEPCIKVDLPVKMASSLLDAAWNAGPRRVCKSPMLAKMNAGDLNGGCEAFVGWIVRSDGKLRNGLIARRGGFKNDPRKDERELCLEGVKEGVAKPEKITLWQKILIFFKTILKGN